MTQGDHATHSEFDGDDLTQLATVLKSVLDIRDRKYGFPPKTYEKCFVGTEAVEKLIKENIAGDESDAVVIGNMLMAAGLFHHVLKDHPFKNERLFYRFASDEDHGAVAPGASGGALSWADLLSPAPAVDFSGPSLQAALPERDPDLATLSQVDVEAVGVAPLDEHNAKLLDCTRPKQWVDPTAKSSYNLVVLGAGAGGLVTAAAAAGVGARVALIEAHLLGGDCLNVGCVPSKALLSCAKMAATLSRASDFGIRMSGEVEVDFPAVMERMRRLRAGIAPHDSAERYAQELGVDVFLGRGTFTGEDTIEVNGQTLGFAKAVIATGASAAVPDIPGLEGAPYLTNATIFNLTELPARMGVIGSGPIGLELAQAFQRLGSQVTVFSRGNEILAKEDRDAAALVEDSLRRDGVRFLRQVEYRRVDSQRGQPPITLVVESGGSEHAIELDALLVAAGRKPAVAGLGLERAGVTYDGRMGVQVDERLQTTNPNVYAVGDVATRYQFTHVADFMARMVVRNALFLGRDKFSNLLIPWATYTDPEVAHVGLYEKDLEEQGIEFVTFQRDLADVDRAIVDGESGFVKMHVKRRSGQILGATIVGSHAGDLISEVTVAMQAGMSLGALAGVVHPYPTVAEAIRQCGDAYNRTRLTPAVKSIFRGLLSLRRWPNGRSLRLR